MTVLGSTIIFYITILSYNLRTWATSLDYRLHSYNIILWWKSLRKIHAHSRRITDTTVRRLVRTTLDCTATIAKYCYVFQRTTQHSCRHHQNNNSNNKIVVLTTSRRRWISYICHVRCIRAVWWWETFTPRRRRQRTHTIILLSWMLCYATTFFLPSLSELLYNVS